MSLPHLMPEEEIIKDILTQHYREREKAIWILDQIAKRFGTKSFSDSTGTLDFEHYKERKDTRKYELALESEKKKEAFYEELKKWEEAFSYLFVGEEL